MNSDIDYIKVDNFHESKKKKHKKKKTSVLTVIVVLLFFWLAATVVFFIIAGNNDSIDVTDGASSAYVPAEMSEVSDNVPSLPAETPVPTPSPTPIPTPAPTPINNNPSTGTVLLRKYSDESCTVSIKNNLEKDCCIVITHVKSETKAVEVFVRAGEECEVKTPSGTYRLTAKTGDVYLSTDSYFGSDTETIDLAEISLPWGETYSVSVNG